MFDPEDLIYVFGLRRARRRQNNLMARCPFGTHDDSHPSFGINLYTGQWQCYSCGEKGTNIRTLAFALKVLLPDNIMMESLVLAPEDKPDKLDMIPHKMDDSFKDYESAFKELKDRGISKAAIKRFSVGYLKGTVKFPCILPDKKMYGWIERNKKWDGRYGYQPSGVKRNFLLFGLDRHIKKAYLVESMTDSLKLISWNVEAVSTCGNMIFKEQARILIQNCDAIVLVPQNDNPAKLWINQAKTHFKGKIVLTGIAINKEFKDIGSDGYTKEMWIKDSAKEKLIH